MSWMQKEEEALSWLLEDDQVDPGPRYFALTDLMDMPHENPEVSTARNAGFEFGPVPEILRNQNPDGYWMDPGPKYLPKYRSTAWSAIFLAQLGAYGEDKRIRAAGDYILSEFPAPRGGLAMDARNSGLIHCLQGNLCAALIDFGFLDDHRLKKALDWMARSVTGTNIASSAEKNQPVRYLRSGNSGPGFLCSANNHLPCAWGAVKVLQALSKIPVEKRTQPVNNAINRGTEFLLSCNPAEVDYPMGYAEKPNRSWFKFGYPIGYITDVLQILEVLTVLGFAGDNRLIPGVELLESKRIDGRWLLEYTYNGKTWVDVEQKGKPSKWVTLRALRVLKRVDESSPE